LVLVAPGYHGDPTGPAADDPVALAGCLADLLDWCRQTGLAALHLLFTGSPALTHAVASLGGLSYPLTTRWTLPVWWQDWPGYLAGLDAKRARELRREHRLATSTLQLAELDPAEHADELVAGRCAVLRRHGQAADPAAEHRRLAMLIERFGDRLTVFGGLADGRLATGCLCRWHDRELQVLYSAVTEAGRAHRFAHFAGTYYAVIEGVSTVRCDAIDYGISHRAGKRARGCTVRRLFGHVLPTDPADRPNLAVATELLDRYAESLIDRGATT
jgi:predicted N-acyltransferase